MKKKIALFYDADTESGKMILDFLSPFDKRKSDIVGRLVLNWIEEHGAAVPVEWFSRKGEMSGKIPLSAGMKKQAAPQREQAAEESRDAGKGETAELERKAQPHDADLIRAGLASFMGS